jgi:phosphohistidine phosphatase
LSEHPVELLLLRHGIAEERSPDRPDDERALTPEGRQRTRRVLERARAMGLVADRLISSPYRRARQTAEIACSVGLAPAVHLCGALAHGADPLPRLSTWWAEADAAARGGTARPRLLLVGHEPDLGLLASRLIGAGPGAVTLKKAGLALLLCPDAAPPSRPAARATLRLLLTPAVMLA